MFWKITENKDWQYLVDTFDWIAGMQHTEQNPFYHGEGNVAEHTRLVLKELEQSDEFQKLDEQNREIPAIQREKKFNSKAGSSNVKRKQRLAILFSEWRKDIQQNRK